MKDKGGKGNRLAKKLGISRQRVSALKQAGKLKTDGDELDIDASARMHQERLAAQQRSPSRQIKDFYDAKMAKLEFEKATGAVVEVERVSQEWRKGVVAVKNRFLGLGRELAPQLAGRGPQEIKTIIDKRVFEILRLLAHQEFHPETDD